MNELTKLLGKVAPWLVAAAGGPAGLATKALGTLAEKLGASEATVDAVAQAVAGATPEQIAATRVAELDFKLHMQELGFKQATDLAKIDADDRADARKMQVATGSRIPAALAILVTLGFFGILGLMLAGVWKPTDNNALLILLGSLGTSWGAIVNFYFGSSAGSARKDELLAKSGPIQG